jgi:hypothetical protein
MHRLRWKRKQTWSGQLIHLWSFLSLSDSNLIVQSEYGLNPFATQVKLYWSLDFCAVVTEIWSFKAIVSSNVSSTFKRTFLSQSDFSIDHSGATLQLDIRFRALLNSKHHCSMRCSWKEFSFRNSLSSLVFVASVLHYKQNIFPSNLHLDERMNSIKNEMARFILPGTSIRASSSQFKLTTERNLVP